MWSHRVSSGEEERDYNAKREEIQEHWKEMQHPLNFQNIQTGQPLICWRTNPQIPQSEWKIALPSALIPDVVE